jgi:hypothetical protein
LADVDFGLGEGGKGRDCENGKDEGEIFHRGSALFGFEMVVEGD